MKMLFGISSKDVVFRRMWNQTFRALLKVTDTVSITIQMDKDEFFNPTYIVCIWVNHEVKEWKTFHRISLEEALTYTFPRAFDHAMFAA